MLQNSLIVQNPLMVIPPEMEVFIIQRLYGNLFFLVYGNSTRVPLHGVAPEVV